MAVHHPEKDPSVPDTLDERGDQKCLSTDEGFNKLENKIDTYFDQICGWFKKQDASQTTVARLASQREIYEAQLLKQQGHMGKCIDKNKLLRSELQELQQMYNESRIEVDKLKKEKNDLRNVILGQAGTEKISDEEIKSKFTSIRQKIQAITYSKAFRLGRSISVPSQCHPEVHKFWDSWNTLSTNDRAFIMRGKIFRLVVDHVLGQKLFGISPTHSHDLQKIESSLKSLETIMTCSQVPANAVVDWRHATMKAIEQTKISHDDCISEVESMILSYFNCLIPRDMDSATLQKLHHDVHNMCEEAYELRFLMRKSKDDYTCQGYSDGINVHDYESALEVHGVLNGGDESSRVAFTICGALIKSSGNGDMEPVVLERAHVVVKHV
ncbi:chromosome segregation ATPase-like protein [Metarhizium robertsii]|uniref:Uncharacterized protein n=2 Tax=Metarhizium robertsii TaxID=568076 RepID=E9EZZ7_METRA|nr:uncharacterized protein MAA_05596 [Metarhizium robertsii ARSEF 23]EFY98457.1 hypothetical protein MAA_05596 [Metarhizium robertsii ARSEF 23]EXV04412.1 chromosome segregation ATPase-like protein [Metarhizium robertsii]